MQYIESFKIMLENLDVVRVHQVTNLLFQKIIVSFVENMSQKLDGFLFSFLSFKSSDAPNINVNF